MAASRSFQDNFFTPFYEVPRPYFVIAGAQEFPVYEPQVVGNAQIGYVVNYNLLTTIPGIEIPNAAAQNNPVLLQTRRTPPNPPFPQQFVISGWLPGCRFPLANFLPVYWPLVVGNGFSAYFVAYSLAGTVETRYFDPFSPLPTDVPQPYPVNVIFPIRLFWD